MNCSPPINLTVKFLQINLRHGRLASATFAQTLLDLDIDIALIQEPYATQVDPKLPPNMPFLPDAYEALHKLDSNHHFGAAIVAKRALNCRFLPDHSQNHVTTALVELDGYTKLLRSLYLRPSLPSLEVELRPLLSRSPVPLARTVIGADANAKSSL